LLSLKGAELVYFSLIRDKNLPEAVDAVYIGGGFPEIYAAELSANLSMRKEIKDFYDGYGVIYAECGGLMYLMKQLEYKPLQGLRGRRAVPHKDEGGSFEMCGVIKGSVKFEEKRVVNYVQGELRRDCILGKRGSRFKGHEFHHSEIILEDPANVVFAYKMLRGEGIKDGMDGIISKNCLASFAHLHAASYTGFAENFVRSASETRRNNF
jgi:cobyrinic acid a,c-diamide synthase